MSKQRQTGIFGALLTLMLFNHTLVILWLMMGYYRGRFNAMCNYDA